MKSPTRFSAPPSDPSLTPFQKFESFARRIVNVPKAEVDKQKAKFAIEKKDRAKGKNP